MQGSPKSLEFFFKRENGKLIVQIVAASVRSQVEGFVVDSVCRIILCRVL